jgi:CBS domain-containing protein
MLSWRCPGSLGCDVLNRKIYEIMSTPPITTSTDATLIDAAKAMYESNVGSVVVVDEKGELAGIVTRRDVLYLVATGEARRNPRVSTIMTTSVITVSPTEDLATALDRMRNAGIKHIVVTENNKPIGVVSMWDIMNAVWRECVERRES